MNRNNTRVRILISTLLLTSLVLPGCGQTNRPEAADIVLVNDGIYTVDANRSWAEAAAVRDGVIVAVGANDEIERHIDDDTDVVDLHGRMAMPGNHDSHIRPLDGGYEQVLCKLFEEWHAANYRRDENEALTR